MPFQDLTEETLQELYKHDAESRSISRFPGDGIHIPDHTLSALEAQPPRYNVKINTHQTRFKKEKGEPNKGGEGLDLIDQYFPRPEKYHRPYYLSIQVDKTSVCVSVFPKELAAYARTFLARVSGGRITTDSTPSFVKEFEQFNNCILSRANKYIKGRGMKPIILEEL